MPWFTSRYERLQANDSEREDEKFPPNTPELATKTFWYSQTLPTVFCIFCLLLNLGIFRYYSNITPNDYAGDIPSMRDLHLERLQSQSSQRVYGRPSQYDGLDKIERPIQQPKERFRIINYPSLVSRIDWRNQSMVYEDDSYYIKTIEISTTVSTLVQFRAIDWGMEDCELHVKLPNRTCSHTNMIHEGNSRTFRVWKASDDDLKISSFTSLELGFLPSYRVARDWIDVASLSFAFCEQDDSNINLNYRFTCPADSLSTFILALVSEGTIDDANLTTLQWSQSKSDDNAAISMTQFQSN